MPRGSGYPTNYKLDVANVALKVGIEIDGLSHNLIERRAADRKKEEFMASIGWRVLRFTNEEVEKNLDGCVQKVLSIISMSPTEIPITLMDS
ncbi:endonuclease domain-containing protein [Nitrospira sp. BLG_1]|uniref:endonuclease domain-containing protein n=1 Tax=Nitrospira sp. BLG_1 TaxID=3395883 RepID=UPI0039BCA5B8